MRASLTIAALSSLLVSSATISHGQPGGLGSSGAIVSDPSASQPLGLPGLGVVPLAETDPVSEAMSSVETAKESAARLKVELEQVRRRHSTVRSTLRLQTRALDRMRRSGIATDGGLGAVLSAYGRRRRLERMLVEQLETYKELGARMKVLGANLERAEVACKDAERTLIERRESARRLESLAYLPSLGVASLPSFGSPSMPMEEPGATSAFAKLQGRLPPPVEGTPTSLRFARRDYDEGIEVVAGPGTTVLAVSDGVVAFAGRQGSFGEIVVLEHEGGFFTVYANLGDSFVRAGARVGARSRIGRTSSVAGQHLFFAIRQGTRSLDARTWMGQ